MKQFIAAASLSSLSELVSARVGSRGRQGYNPAASDSGVFSQEHYHHRSGNRFIDNALTMAMRNEDEVPSRSSPSIIRNIQRTKPDTIKNHSQIFYDKDINYIDLGILSSTNPPANSRPSVNNETPRGVCMMGSYAAELFPADIYLQRKKDDGTERFSKIIFDAASNTVFCNQPYDHGHTYSCKKMQFQGCDYVKCNGKQACVDALIEDAKSIECEGYESCLGASLDATVVDCGGERACMNAIIGDNQLVETLDCHSGQSSCASVVTYSVGEAFCTGPLSCYGAQLHGVQSRVTCQGVQHPDGYYMPTCGGDEGGIAAEIGKDIDVICSGDFACIGYGHRNNDAEEIHYSNFDINVGSGGSLTCEGSLVGNEDGETFVCQYIDVIQGCDSFECKESYFTFVNRAISLAGKHHICSNVLSIGLQEKCNHNIDHTVDAGDSPYSFAGGDDDDDDDDGVGMVLDDDAIVW